MLLLCTVNRRSMSIRSVAHRVLKNRCLSSYYPTINRATIITRLMMEESRYVAAVIILILLVMSTRILMSRQILPFDYLLYQFYVVFIDFWTSIHKHHNIVVRGGVVPSRLGHVGWESASCSGRIRCVYIEHSWHIGYTYFISQARRNMNIFKEISLFIYLSINVYLIIRRC